VRVVWGSIIYVCVCIKTILDYHWIHYESLPFFVSVKVETFLCFRYYEPTNS
jgi:hypothetical protein